MTDARSLAVVLVVAVSACGTERARDERGRDPELAPLVVRDPDARADAEDRDRALRRQVARSLASRPAMQRLPYAGRRIQIELVAPTSDGLVRLRITSDLPLPQARAAYRRFLVAAGDPGHAYRPTFRSVG